MKYKQLKREISKVFDALGVTSRTVDEMFQRTKCNPQKHEWTLKVLSENTITIRSKRGTNYKIMAEEYKQLDPKSKKMVSHSVLIILRPNRKIPQYTPKSMGRLPSLEDYDRYEE